MLKASSGTAGCRPRRRGAWTAALPPATLPTRVGAGAPWGTASPPGTNWCTRRGSGVLKTWRDTKASFDRLEQTSVRMLWILSTLFRLGQKDPAAGYRAGAF